MLSHVNSIAELASDSANARNLQRTYRAPPTWRSLKISHTSILCGKLVDCISVGYSGLQNSFLAVLRKLLNILSTPARHGNHSLSHLQAMKIAAGTKPTQSWIEHLSINRKNLARQLRTAESRVASPATPSQARPTLGMGARQPMSKARARNTFTLATQTRSLGISIDWISWLQSHSSSCSTVQGLGVSVMGSEWLRRAMHDSIRRSIVEKREMRYSTWELSSCETGTPCSINWPVQTLPWHGLKPRGGLRWF